MPMYGPHRLHHSYFLLANAINEPWRRLCRLECVMLSVCHYSLLMLAGVLQQLLTRHLFSTGSVKPNILHSQVRLHAGVFCTNTYDRRTCIHFLLDWLRDWKHADSAVDHFNLRYLDKKWPAMLIIASRSAFANFYSLRLCCFREIVRSMPMIDCSMKWSPGI